VTDTRMSTAATTVTITTTVTTTVITTVIITGRMSRLIMSMDRPHGS
jgi:hypothetical protein